MKKGKAIVVEGLTFHYPDTEAPALNNISFSLEHGEILGILGPTGAGKTTLAMTLNGLIPHVIHGELTGKVIVEGRDVSEEEVAEMAPHVGYVFQEPENQLSQMTVEEEVAFGMGNLGVPREEMVPRIKEALETVGLSGYEKRSPLALSGGQQQRLAIASVLAMRPSILILDEPTSMLDPAGKNEVYHVLQKLKEADMTGIVIDHEVERLAVYCDKILVLDEGECRLFGSPGEIFRQLGRIHRCRLRAPQVTELTGRLNRKLNWNLPYPTTLKEAVAIYQRAEPERGKEGRVVR